MGPRHKEKLSSRRGRGLLGLGAMLAVLLGSIGFAASAATPGTQSGAAEDQPGVVATQDTETDESVSTDEDVAVGLAPTHAKAALGARAGRALLTNAITDVWITNWQGNPLPPGPVAGSNIRVYAKWQAPPETKAGDTFELSWPNAPAIGAIGITFDLENDGGDSLGTCVVAGSTMTCTFNASVETVADVTGDLHFQARWTQPRDGDIEFELGNGVKFTLEGVPNVGVPSSAAPSDPRKTGWVGGGGRTAEFRVLIPGENTVDADGRPVKIKDTITFSEASLGTGDFSVYKVPTGEYNPLRLEVKDKLAKDVGYKFLTPFTKDGYELELINPDPSGDYVYALRYTLELPADYELEGGETVKNRVKGEGWERNAAVLLRDAGGTGSGQSGKIAVTKSVTGESASEVGDSVDFEVGYCAVLPNGVQTVGYESLANGETFTSPSIRHDVDVTVFELAQPAVAGVIWRTASFSGDGVQSGQITEGCEEYVRSLGIAAVARVDVPGPDDGGEPATAAVTLTNRADRAVGSVSIQKLVTGDAKGAVVGKEFGFTATFGVPEGADPVAAEEFKLADGAVKKFTNLPAGTKVTFEEVNAPADTAALDWESPVFSENPVTVVSEREGPPVQVTATNEVNWVLGEVSITKLLDGGGVSAVDPDTEFTVTASFEVPEGADPIADAEIQIRAGQTLTIKDLPVGTVVTFDEDRPADDGVVNWGEHVFSDNDIVVSRAAPGQDPVTVELTNFVERATGTPPATGVPGTLASTGASGTLALSLGALALLAGGGLLVWRGRKGGNTVA